MKKLILLLAAVSVLTFGCASPDTSSAPKHRKVAVQAYSYNRFTAEETINKIKDMGLDGIELYPNQRLSDKYPGVKVNYTMNAEQRAYLKKLLADANLKAVSFGVTHTKNDAEVEKVCEFAKDMGIKTVLTEDPVIRFAAWEKFGKKYGVKMAVHHHTFSSSNQYFDPEVLCKFVKGHDNVKSNPDVGHWARCGIDPVKALHTLRGTIGSVHFKDQKEFGNYEDQPVPFGEGAMDVKGMLEELDSQGYDGFYVIEYEAEWDNPTPSILKCVKYLRNN